MTDRTAHEHASAQSGFTLVEMLVALAIFAMLAGGSVMLLRGSVDSQQTIGRHLDALGDLQRAVTILDSDLGQATSRISRTRSGTFAPAFFGRAQQSDEPLFEFVRGGWSNNGKQRHAAIQKVEYWWRKDRIERVGYPAVDGADAPDPSVVLDHVKAVTLRYRAPTGEWLERWAVPDPAQLPVAMELVLTREGEAPLIMRFLVGPGNRPAEGEAPKDPLEGELGG